jgi:hypothetical protein
VKVILTLLITFSALLHGGSVKVAFEPSVSSEILDKELAPLFSHLNSEYGSVMSVPSVSANNFLKLSQLGDINFVYAGSAYASILIDRFGFKPLLSSIKEVEIGVLANAHEDYALLKNNPEVELFHVPFDLYGRYMVGKIDFKARLASRSNSERIIFSVLKKSSNLGVIFKDDLGLIPTYLSQKLKMHDTLNIGRVYLLVGPNLLTEANDIQKSMLNFHENWQGPNNEYFYLSFYKFTKWRTEHKEGMYVSKDFQSFLKSIQVK